MNATWAFLMVLSLVCHTESRCSPTTYYKNCWIRRFPGIFINIEESQRRGAQLLRFYQEESALKCSRTCCLMRNFSCNLAIFHYETTQDNANCFHLHCPTLESCILSHRGNVVLYNITNGVDPDLLVFGKYFTSNVRVLPHHYGRVNASDTLPSDKRQFIHPPPPNKPPLTSAHPVRPLTPASDATTSAEQQRTCRPTSASLTTAASSSLSPSPNSEADVQTVSSSTESDSTTPSSFTTDYSVGQPNTEMTPSLSTPEPFTFIPTHQQTSIPQETSNSPSTPTTDINTQPASSTEGSLERNQTEFSGGGQGVGTGDTVTELGPGWPVAAHTILVAVAICVTVLLSCCCSVLLVATWRGQRRRMGRYRTSWRGKKGSMRLIKYVLVRENS